MKSHLSVCPVVDWRPARSVCPPGTGVVLTESASSGWCMVMQSMLIWMVFPADPSTGLSVKFSSMGWTACIADLQQSRRLTLNSVSSRFVFLLHCHSLVQHVKQLVEHILAQGFGHLWWLALRHGGEEWALSPGQTRWRIPESAGTERRKGHHIHSAAQIPNKQSFTRGISEKTQLF